LGAGKKDYIIGISKALGGLKTAGVAPPVIHEKGVVL
jgi:hypothetical protein